eukprot:1140558-Pelagomonas_calceolata.AAC.4
MDLMDTSSEGALVKNSRTRVKMPPPGGSAAAEKMRVVTSTCRVPKPKANLARDCASTGERHHQHLPRAHAKGKPCRQGQHMDGYAMHYKGERDSKDRSGCASYCIEQVQQQEWVCNAQDECDNMQNATRTCRGKGPVH